MSTIKGVCLGQECGNYVIKLEPHGCWCDRAVEFMAGLPTSQQFLGANPVNIFPGSYV